MRLEPPVPKEALAAIRAPFARAGAVPIDIPVLQPLGLLIELTGEAMRPRLFVVQAEGGEELALRPDFTIGVARSHIESGAASGRYLYEGRIFRSAGESARAEEFLQIGVEAYEAGPPAKADAETLALAWAASVAGGREDLTIQVGDMALFAAFVDSLGLDKALSDRLKRAFSRPRLLRQELDEGFRPSAQPGGGLAAVLAGLPEDAAAAALEELWALADIEPVGGRPAAEIVHRLKTRTSDSPRLTPAQIARVRDFLAVEGRPDEALAKAHQLAGGNGAFSGVMSAWAERLADLEAAGVPADRMVLSTAFSRDFGYYDGVLFEVHSAALGPDRPVAAGGRYDSLLRRLDGPGGGAVGCMVRPARAYKGGAE